MHANPGFLMHTGEPPEPPPLDANVDHAYTLAHFDRYTAVRRGSATLLRVWYPSRLDVLEGFDPQGVFIEVNAPAHERAEALDTLAEEIPGAVITSAAVSGGARPPRVLKPAPPGDDEWPKEPRTQRRPRRTYTIRR